MSANLPTKVPTPTTIPSSSSLIYIVDAPYTAPVDDATTLGNAVKKGHGLADGIVKVASGVMTPATANTDYATPNQDTTGKSAKTDALRSATTVVDVSAATAPTTGQVLTAVDSTHATWQPAAGGGGTPQMSWSTNFTGWTPTTFGGVIGYSTGGGSAPTDGGSGPGLTMQSNNVSGGKSAIYSNATTFPAYPLWSKNFGAWWAFSTSFLNGSFSPTTGAGGSMMYVGTNAGDTISGWSASGVGFYVNHATNHLFAFTHDGGGSTQTDINSAYPGNGNNVIVSLAYTPTSIAFYVNGTLATTITTHIPTGSWGGIMGMTGYTSSSNYVFLNGYGFGLNADMF